MSNKSGIINPEQHTHTQDVIIINFNIIMNIISRSTNISKQHGFKDDDDDDDGKTYTNAVAVARHIVRAAADNFIFYI